MKKLLLASLVLLLVSCNLAQPVTPPLARGKLSTTKDTTALPTQPEGLYITTVGSWNIRRCAKATCQHLFTVGNGTRLKVLNAGSGWYFVSVVDEDPDNVFTGWINNNCCEEK